MSEVRADKLQGIWALDAETTIPVSPTTGTAYRNTTFDVTEGFKFNTKSPSEAVNQWLYTASKVIDQLQTLGTLGYNSTTTYPSGAITMASDGAIYQCILAALGKDPTTETSYWTKLDVLNRAKTDLSNITTVAITNDNNVKTAPDVVTSYWVATDGLSFYRKWKSGYIEQGGRVTLTGTSNSTPLTGSVTFPTSFSTVASVRVVATNNESSGAISNDTANGSGAYNETITGCTLYGKNFSTSCKVNWFACGF